MSQQDKAIEKAKEAAEHTAKVLVFDLETTGLDINRDEPIQFAASLLLVSDIEPAVEIKHFFSYIKPTKARVTDEAREVHKISEDTLATAPTLSEIYDKIEPLFAEAHIIAGHNIAGFDLPLLAESLGRAGLEVPFSPSSLILDTQAVFAEDVPRSLEQAVKVYGCESEVEAYKEAVGLDTHNAIVDVAANGYVLDSMIDKRLKDRTEDGETVSERAAEFIKARGLMPQEVTTEQAVGLRNGFQVALCSMLSREKRLGYCNRIVWNNDAGGWVYGFGKHKGQLVKSELGFARWMLGQQFIPNQLKEAIQKEFKI